MLTVQERINSYIAYTGFPKSIFLGDDNRIYGTWVMGNNYQVKSQYYGGYPPTYLKRIKALFPEKTKVLHLFSGKVDLGQMPGDTVDINQQLTPTWVDDAQSLDAVPVANYDLVLADPPYSIEDTQHYGTTFIKRNKVMRALGRKLAKGAHVVWLDQVLPMYKKDDFKVVAYIGMVKSTNHRFRVITIFEKI